MTGDPAPTLESGESDANPPPPPNSFANAPLTASELLPESDLAAGAGCVATCGAATGAVCEAGVLNDPEDELCCSAGWALGSADCLCWATAAGAACGAATGAGRFNTRTMATTAATSVAMLMMRSSLIFMAFPGPGPLGERALMYGTGPVKGKSDDQSDVSGGD